MLNFSDELSIFEMLSAGPDAKGTGIMASGSALAGRSESGNMNYGLGRRGSPQNGLLELLSEMVAIKNHTKVYIKLLKV